MTRFAPVLASLCLTVSLATPTLASPCSEQIDALFGKVKAQTTDAIAASTSGQAAAAKRSGEGVTGTEGQRKEDAPEAPPEKSAEAGKGADAAQQAGSPSKKPRSPTGG